jgi:RNA polymerase sigma-70 factor (ECF subfamily)
MLSTTRRGASGAGADSVDTGEVHEARLLAAARLGDRDAIGELLTLHYPGMYYLALRYTGDADHADDVLQDTCVRVLRHIGQFRGESRFSSWMARIVINSARLRHRGNKRLVPVGDRLDVDRVCEAVDPEKRVSDQEILQQVEEYLGSLRDGDLQLFVRRFVRGETVRRISDETGVSVPAIKTRVHRARSKLKARFDGELAI